MNGHLQSLQSFIEGYCPVPEQDWEQIASCFEQRIVEKDELVLEAGKICRYLYFVESGLLRYYILKDGKELTKFFTEAPYCFTSQVSFTSKKPAAETIQAIEHCVLWQTGLEQANALLALPSWNTFIRKLLQEVQSYTEDILQELQTETAESRYQKLLAQNPTLLQRIPLQYLASYFGIAPQSLSRIRKKLAAGNRT